MCIFLNQDTANTIYRAIDKQQLGFGAENMVNFTIHELTVIVRLNTRWLRIEISSPYVEDITFDDSTLGSICLNLDHDSERGTTKFISFDTKKANPLPSDLDNTMSIFKTQTLVSGIMHQLMNHYTSRMDSVLEMVNEASARFYAEA